MDKQKTYDYLIKGMMIAFTKEKSSKLFNQIVGLKFKSLRLKKNITVEAVVDDNKTYFKSVYDLYKFEKGIKSDGSKLCALQSYFKYDVKDLFDRLN